MNLAYKYPMVYWNTANLIVDSGGIQSFDDEEIEDATLDVVQEKGLDEIEEELAEWEEANEIEAEEIEEKKKKKNNKIDYGRIASAIGRMKNEGIEISPPDINESSFTFTPVPKDNKILYGLRGITRISMGKIGEILAARPYDSMQDFLSKIKINKIQMSNLIKSGAFDSIEAKPREEIMHDYIELIADKKQRLTLQNMQMLITKELIPDEMAFYGKLFLFNKYLKTCKFEDMYMLNDAAINFVSTNVDADLIFNGNSMLQKSWDSTYKKMMDVMRDYLKEHKEEMLKALNDSLFKEMADKYSLGNISAWEMDSISFYYHDHELANAAQFYDDFFKLSEEPEIEYTFPAKGGGEVKVWKLHQIIGTVIDKDKKRNTVTLLTPTGVVNVKIYKNQYAIYDKQISYRNADGTKKVLEKSWFTRGTKLMVQGIRRGNDFIPKKRAKSIYPIISKVTQIHDDGRLEFQYERMEV